ncbi:matrin-3-like isoform X2 [Tachysurus fulvidraco]|uniref:matrin-3-like isoform X2 n=1 Tax=Tachysurus fulvidraco TaxID=1234273 RepID=UPI001FF0604F|nr:matrin-3-like isoform X2 [Tachysurus fulvidraco]
MSQKYHYTNTGDDFLSHQDMYADSYQRQSNTYKPSSRSSSQEQTRSTTSSNRTVDSSVHLPGKALSFLHSCGLDPSDLALLAELPEHLITVETLPKLLLQVKERKLSSSRPSTNQPLDDTSACAFEGSSNPTPVEYPIARPVHPVYPLPPEQVQTWQDRWGNPRRTSTLTTSISCSSSKSSTVPDYSLSTDSDPYCNTTESPEPSSQSFVDSGPRPLLSLRLEPPVITPTKNVASDFNCKVPPAFPHVCHLCDISIHSTRDWFFHVRGSEHAKSQLELVKKYPKWDQTVESSRKESFEVYKVPTRKEASDFNGVVPPVFPYLCVLCNITVFSEKDWSAHVTGGQHAQSQLDLMAKYPVWDGTVRSSRRNDGNTSTDMRDGTSKGKTSDMMSPQANDEPGSRIVSFKPLPVGDGITAELTAIAKRFGSVKKSLFLPNQGYVEMTCLAEAKKVVEHYSVNQLKLKGKLIQVAYSYEYNSLRETEANDIKQSRRSHKQRRSSPGIRSIQRDSSCPRRRHSSDRTRSSPKRRHSSERTRSSPNRRLSSERTHSSTNRRLSSERTHSSTNRRLSSERTHSSTNRRLSSERTRSSPNRRHSSERTRSSPNRRHSSERTHSGTKRKPSAERTHSSTKRKRSAERTHTSPKRRHSPEKTHSSRSRHVKEGEDFLQFMESASSSSNSCHSLSPVVKAETSKSNADAEERKSVSNNNVGSMDSDSDLEGLEVIADDGEELAHDIDDYEPTRSDQENLSSDPMDVTDIHTEEELNTGENSPHSDTSETSNCVKEGQKLHKHKEQEIKEEDHDIPKILENCVTLDEFTEEDFSDCQESDEAKHSILQTQQSEPESPTEEPESLAAEPESPTEEPESLAAEPESPTEEPESLAAEPESLTAEPESLTEEPESLTAEPESLTAEPESLTAEPESPTEEPESPTEEPESLTAEPESPTEEPKSPTEEPESPTEEPESLTEEPESPTEEPELLTEETESPTAEPELPTAEPELPTEGTSKTTAEPHTSEILEEAAFQLKEEHETEVLTDEDKENFGKVLEVRNLPSAEDYTDLDFLNIIKRYGDVIHHVLFRSCKKGFVEMALTSDAERVAADSKNRDIALRGKVLKIKVSENYCHLPEDGCNNDGSDSDDEDISKESNNKQQSDELNGNTDSSNETLKTDEPVGTEFVRPVVGYFCNLCNVIYATEEEAKDGHCKSPSHREKVKEHKEKCGSVKNRK